MSDQGTNSTIVLPDNARVIMVSSTYVTVKEYARRTGRSVSAVQHLVDDGKLPVRRMGTKGSAVEINLAAELSEALEDVGVQPLRIA